MKKITLFTFALALLIAGSSHASLVLKIEDIGAGTITTVLDVLDIGEINYSTTNGQGTSISLKIKSHNPFGDAVNDISASNQMFYPFLSLGGTINTQNSIVDLKISVTDTGFIYQPYETTPRWPQSFMVVDSSFYLNNNNKNRFLADYYYNPSNTEFDQSNAVTNHIDTDDTWDGRYNRVDIDPLLYNPFANPFSLTQVINVHAFRFQNLYFDSSLYVIPEPGTLALVLVGMIFLASRKFNQLQNK